MSHGPRQRPPLRAAGIVIAIAVVVLLVVLHLTGTIGPGVHG